MTYATMANPSTTVTTAATNHLRVRFIGLTTKAEPPPTRGVNRDSGTASANGGWLRRLVRPHGHINHQNLHHGFLSGFSIHSPVSLRTQLLGTPPTRISVPAPWSISSNNSG